MLRAWIYHKTEKPKIIDLSDLDKYKEDGWKDTPASFVTHSDVGIDTEKLEDGDLDEAFKAQQVTDSIKGITDYCNSVLNLDAMTKKELLEFAEKHLNKKMNKNATKPKLVDKIRGYMSDDC